LHGGQDSLAFRIPKKQSLRALLRKTGPLVAPSANPQGKAPASKITEAKQYFGDRVDFYVRGAIKKGKPSTVISFSADGGIILIRDGAVKIKNA
jgi:L-threonylcarbamoyladenylate synthase